MVTKWHNINREVIANPFLLLALPSTDNEASHQEDEENNSPCDRHSQNGRLIRVPYGQNIYKREKVKTVI